MKKYQKVSDLVGKVNVKYDEDLLRFEAERTGPGLWSYAGFHPNPQEPEFSVIPLKRRAHKGYRKGLAAIK